MEDFTVDYIEKLTKAVNKKRDELFKKMEWKKGPSLNEGDVRIVMEVANNQEFKSDKTA